MSKTGVIVALVVALLLAAAALFLRGKGGSGAAPPPGPLLAFDPAKVTELRLTREDGRFEAVKRGAVPGMWEVVLGGKGPERAWPADSGRMRAALRILSTLEEDRQAAQAGSVEPGAPQVRLTLDDGTARTLRVSSRTLGGNVLVEVVGVPGAIEGRGAWVGADVGQMLVTTGPREWRDRSALPGIGPDASRITLKGEKGTLGLARVQGRWGVREPVQEAADPEAVAKLLAVLGNILVTDFLDDAIPERTGLDKPVAELTIGSDQRDDQGKIHSTSRTLRVGQQADIAGKSVFADVAGTGDAGPRVLTVSAEGLGGLTTDPSAYLSRKSIQVAAADVGTVVITPAGGPPRRYERDLDGWFTIGAAGAETPCVKADADAIGGLLNLLTQMPADSLAMGEAWPTSWGTHAGSLVAAVEIGSAGGTPLANIAVFAAVLPGKAQTPQIVVNHDAIWRAYAVDASSPLIAWLGRGM